MRPRFVRAGARCLFSGNLLLGVYPDPVGVTLRKSFLSRRPLISAAQLSAFKKLFPCGITPPNSPQWSAHVRQSLPTPRLNPCCFAGVYARIGTYSREWSVVGQRGSGSQPWSAVIIRDRAPSATAGTTPAPRRTPPVTAQTLPHPCGDQEHVEIHQVAENQATLRSLAASTSFSIPSALEFVVT